MIKQTITENQFLKLHENTQAMLFNELYAELYGGLIFRGVEKDDKYNMYSIKCIQICGDDWDYPVYVSNVCDKITIGFLINILYNIGELNISMYKERINSECFVTLEFENGNDAIYKEDRQLIDLLIKTIDTKWGEL